MLYIENNRQRYKKLRSCFKQLIIIFAQQNTENMKASISYQELQRIVTEKAQQPIGFQFIDNKTIKVLYTLNLGIAKKDLGVNLRVLDIHGSDLRVCYSTGFGMDSLVGLALDLLRKKIPEGLLEEQPNKVLLVHLGSIDSLKQVFETIEVKEVNMLPNDVELTGEFRN